MTFSKRLRKLRKEKGLTLKQMADKFHKTKATFSAYENGVRKPSINLVSELANYFGVSIDYLMGESNLKHSNEKIKQALENNPELMQFWEQLSERNDLQLLFKQTQNLSPEAIRKVVEFMQMIENEHHKEG